MRRSQISKWFSPYKPHLETRRGTRQQAKEYCEKTNSRLDGPWSIGDFSTGGQGTRNDLLLIKEKLKNNIPEKEIAEDHFPQWLRYHKAFREFRRLICPIRDWMPEVIVLIGPTGTGKSRWALQNTSNGYWKQRSQWWDGYENQEHVILDEFYGWLPFDVLLRICDRYPLLVETKGGQTTFLAKKIVITSNKLPDTWYQNCYFQSFERRVTTWIIIQKENEINSFQEYSEAKNFYNINNFVFPIFTNN